jgi:AcrR family transcriptional regulator
VVCTGINLHGAVHVPTLTCVDERQQRRRRDAEANRDSLLDAALRGLAEDPDDSIDAVARAAGLARRTVYGHFPSRDALVTALADRAGQGLADVVRVVRAGRTDAEHPLTTLARLEIALWRSIERYRLLGRLATRPEHLEHVVRHTGDVRAFRMELVETGRAHGARRTAMPCEVVVRLVQAVPLTVFDAVVDGTLNAGDAARVTAVTALAIAGADPAQVDVHVDAALLAPWSVDRGLVR